MSRIIESKLRPLEGYPNGACAVWIQATKSNQEDIGAIYKLKSGKFEGCPWVGTAPCRIFNNPHLAERYIRESTGTF